MPFEPSRVKLKIDPALLHLMESLCLKNSPENGPTPLNCQQQGTMSYGDDAPRKWSACSRSDLQAHYNQVLLIITLIINNTYLTITLLGYT